MSDINEIKSLAETQSQLLKTTSELKAAFEKAGAEIDGSKKTSVETKAALEALSSKASELTDKCLELERKMSDRADKQSESQDVGTKFVNSDEFKSLARGNAKTAKVEFKAAIINALGQNQPLVADQRVPSIINNPNRVFTIRDLMMAGRTTSNLIQFTKENVYTNNAGVQYASPARENVTKPESGITFTLANAPVVTIAHWIPVSKQVLEDSPQLQSYINGRLIYGLKLEEEDQLLNGDGTGGNISGILDAGNFTAYNRAATGDTKIDTIRRAITQAAIAEYPVDAVVINPQDWETIELQKSTQGEYIFTNPMMGAAPQLWGRRVVATNSIAAGTFLVGAFMMGAQIWDRADATVEISFENGTDFVKNMATLLAEERLALTVFRPGAFVSGSF